LAYQNKYKNMPDSDDDYFLWDEEEKCYPPMDTHPYHSDSEGDPSEKISFCLNCDECKNDHKCKIGQCYYCPNSIYYNIHNYIHRDGQDEVKISKIDQSSSECKLGFYHLTHNTTHNITIINNNCDYDSQFDHNDNNIIISNYEGLSIHVDEIKLILDIFKKRLDED
jgi:hypothetical protein